MRQMELVRSWLGSWVGHRVGFRKSWMDRDRELVIEGWGPDSMAMYLKAVSR